MIPVPTAPWAQYLGDLAAWIGAMAGGWWIHRRYPSQAMRLQRRTDTGYFIALALGGVAGAWAFGSLNSLRAAAPTFSHSLAGALAGGIAGVEYWKWRRGVIGSTGAPFVLPLCLGIAIGRWGCLFAGIADGTYGTPTQLPWAVDLGDGIGRHPVQIYESLAMLIFLFAWLDALRRGRKWPWRGGFHAMIIVYAVQRFAWEFLKPYPPLVGPFNLFHILMLGLVVYGVIWIDRGAPRPAH